MKKNFTKYMIILTAILLISVVFMYLYSNSFGFPSKTSATLEVQTTSNTSVISTPSIILTEEISETIQLSSITETTLEETSETTFEETSETTIKETQTAEIEETSENNEIPTKTLAQPDSDKQDESSEDSYEPVNPDELEFKYIALTFDDGPYEPVDSRILNLLNQYEGHATFFMIGQNVNKAPDLLNRIIEQGSEIGNHSFNHPDYTTISMDQVLEEINATNKAITDITGQEVPFYRPPYGALNGEVLSTIGMPSILWNVDTLDWQSKDTNAIAEQILSANSGSIVLMHSLYEQTAEALEIVIPQMYAAGYRFVTISQLLEIYGMPLVNNSYINAFEIIQY